MPGSEASSEGRAVARGVNDIDSCCLRALVWPHHSRTFSGLKRAIICVTGHGKHCRIAGESSSHREKLRRIGRNSGALGKTPAHREQLWRIGRSSGAPGKTLAHREKLRRTGSNSGASGETLAHRERLRRIGKDSGASGEPPAQRKKLQRCETVSDRGYRFGASERAAGETMCVLGTPIGVRFCCD